MRYYSAVKKNEILPSATTWMDQKGIVLSKKNKSEREIQVPYDFTYMRDLNNYINEQTKQK